MIIKSRKLLFMGSRAQPMRKADNLTAKFYNYINLTAICEPIL
jgi:hypothetical protein